MTIGIDRDSLSAVKNNTNEYIYLFKEETFEDLKKLNVRCVRYDKLDYVDINLSKYDINCLKRANTNESDFDKLPSKFDYKFAVIVPNYNNDHGDYNGKTFLQNCIEGVLNQTYKNFELIIVDDCSIDTSVETIKSYKDKRIHLIQNKRKRYNGGSRNVGIDYALDNLDFDYFCFLDSDDWWKHNEVLNIINSKLYNHELMILGCETLGNKGIMRQYMQMAKTYEDIWSLTGVIWCTAWSRVIRKDKIVYFCENTLMEDRLWAYKLADNIDFKNVVNLNQIVYVWNRMNVTNSVSQVRDSFWNASAYCHIGHQMQFLTTLKHKEFIPKLQERINECKRRANNGIYQQY